MDDYGLPGKLLLPLAIVAAAYVMPKPEAPQIVVEIAEFPAAPSPTIIVEVPDFPELGPQIVNVMPSEPVLVDKIVEVEKEKRIEIPVDHFVPVEIYLDAPRCLELDNLPSFDLAKAITVTRPGEAWMLDGDSYAGLVWLDSTHVPSMAELIGGWLSDIEKGCE